MAPSGSLGEPVVGRDERRALIIALVEFSSAGASAVGVVDAIIALIIALIDDRMRLERGDHKAQTIGSALDGMGQCGPIELQPYRVFGQYLTEKTSAMAARMQGDIDKALQHEGACESLYKRLPEGWRW